MHTHNSLLADDNLGIQNTSHHGSTTTMSATNSSLCSYPSKSQYILSETHKIVTLPSQDYKIVKENDAKNKLKDRFKARLAVKKRMESKDSNNNNTRSSFPYDENKSKSKLKTAPSEYPKITVATRGRSQERSEIPSSFNDGEQKDPNVLRRSLSLKRSTTIRKLRNSSVGRSVGSAFSQVSSTVSRGRSKSVEILKKLRFRSRNKNKPEPERYVVITKIDSPTHVADFPQKDPEVNDGGCGLGSMFSNLFFCA